MFKKIAVAAVLVATCRARPIVSTATPAAAMSDGAAAAIGLGAFAAGALVAGVGQNHSGGYSVTAAPATTAIPGRDACRPWVWPIRSGIGMCPSPVPARPFSLRLRLRRAGPGRVAAPITDRFGQPFQRCCSITAGVRTCYGHW